MSFCINATELRAALREIEAAEKNGFQCCLAVSLIGIGTCLYFMNVGRLALKGTLDVGRIHEGAAVRDYLADRIPGVKP